MPRRVYIGTAGWSIPRGSVHLCGGDGTHLERYARVLNGAEINSSFYRPHRPGTYERWAASTPAGFVFAVKVPRAITHELKLRRARARFDAFLAETAGLGSKRGPLLVQLPPSLEFDVRVATRFFDMVRARTEGAVVCEPRHETWFTARAEALFVRHRVGRVAADPARAAGADVPGGWPSLVYYRLHGSPRTYWSRYDADYVVSLAAAIRRVPATTDVWCAFDNTAAGAAFENACELQSLLFAG